MSRSPCNSFVIDGVIEVFIEHQKQPFLTWKDPSPLQIKYFGFHSFDIPKAEFFYNCPGEQPHTHDQLRNSCKSKVVSEYEYREFMPVPDNQQAGHQLNFPVYITGAKDAHILLAPEAKADGDVYEICEFYTYFVYYF